jgi:phosphonopyruvate decarboxylase
LFEYRAAHGQGHQNDFLMVGAMGLASAFAAEIALQRPDEKVILLDGDGALLMSAGNLATVGHYAPRNFYHIVFDNGCHESTGGQPSTSPTVNLEMLAIACGYRGAVTVETLERLSTALAQLNDGPFMIIVKVRPGSRKDLGRPTTTPVENRDAFMARLGVRP